MARHEKKFLPVIEIFYLHMHGKVFSPVECKKIFF